MSDRTQYHWWLVAHDNNDTTLIYGSGISEEAARQHGLEILPGLDFEVRKLPTRNLARASSILKGKRLEETHSLKEATKRLKHKPKSTKKSSASAQYHNQHDPW